MRASIEKFFKDGILWLAEKNSAEELERHIPTPALPTISGPTANFGIPEVDKELQDGGLQFSRLHEWFSYSPTIFSVLLGNSFKAAATKSPGIILWIGKECWPAPHILEQASLLTHCLFIDADDQKNKYWCFEAALRSPAVAAAICNLKGVNLSATRRLALAAQKGAALGFLVRPEREAKFVSAASTRWRLTPVPSPSFAPRWQLLLIKQKGKQSAINSWTIELREDEEISLHIPADVADKSRSTASDQKRLSA